MRNDTLVGDASDVRTERLANQAEPITTLVSQAQQERTEITQIITASGVASVAGTANQITVSTPTGNITLSLPSTVSIGTAFQIGGVQVVSARKAAVADVASANATDLPTVITLANEIKAQLNALLNRVRASTGHGLIS
jgi:hypothetical protein